MKPSAAPSATSSMRSGNSAPRNASGLASTRTRWSRAPMMGWRPMSATSPIQSRVRKRRRSKPTRYCVNRLPFWAMPSACWARMPNWPRKYCLRPITLPGIGRISPPSANPSVYPRAPCHLSVCAVWNTFDVCLTFNRIISRHLTQIATALTALYIIWGSTYLAIRFALQGGFPPFLLGGVRFIVAGSLMYAFLRWRGSPRTQPGAMAQLGDDGRCCC